MIFKSVVDVPILEMTRKRDVWGVGETSLRSSLFTGACVAKDPIMKFGEGRVRPAGQRSGRWASQGDYPTYGLSHWVYRQDNKLCIVI